MKLNRPSSPDFLNEKWEEWGKAFENQRNKNPNFVFQWKTYQKETINKILLPLLQTMTAEHCAYCDGYPFGMSRETIDHFRPKSKFPLLAYQWENLFLCCDRCQTIKGEQFDILLLKPDEEDYFFENYFIINYKEGSISPNPMVNNEAQIRAKKTIELLKLNDKNLCENRKRALREFKKKTHGKDINVYGSRFFLI
jgi:uncharacterized protein (TIGR02646 family)